MRTATLVFLLAACTPESDDTGTPIETIGWDVSVVNLASIPQEGALVCTDAGCETSDGQGEVHVELPIGQSVLSVTYDGLQNPQPAGPVSPRPGCGKAMRPTPAWPRSRPA